jgi:hypothetical protein
MTGRLTAVVERAGGGDTALCPEVDVASQGRGMADALGGRPCAAAA